MFYIIEHRDEYVKVYDTNDNSKELISLKTLEENWDILRGKFAGNFYTEPYDDNVHNSLYSVPLSPFDVFSNGISSKPALTQLFNRLGIYTNEDFYHSINTISGLLDLDMTYYSCNIALALRNHFIKYSKYLDDLLFLVSNNRRLSSIDSYKTADYSLRYLVFAYYSTYLGVKYNITDISPMMHFKEVGLDISKEDRCYIVEYDNEYIASYYYIVSKHIGVVTPVKKFEERVSLRDCYPQQIKLISKYTGTMKPIKVDGNKLYLKGAGFYTFEELAKMMILDKGD